MGAEHGEIFSAHLLVLEDTMLIEEVISKMKFLMSKMGLLSSSQKIFMTDRMASAFCDRWRPGASSSKARDPEPEKMVRVTTKEVRLRRTARNVVQLSTFDRMVTGNRKANCMT